MIKKLKTLLNKTLSASCAALLAFMSILTCYQVFMRYVIRRPSTISEDILSYSFVWVSLLATALVFGEQDHMNLSFFTDKLNNKARKIVLIFSELLILTIAVLVFVYGGQGFMMVGALQVSPTLGITMNYIYSILPVTGVLIGLYSIINIVEIATKTDTKEKEANDK